MSNLLEYSRRIAIELKSSETIVTREAAEMFCSEPEEHNLGMGCEQLRDGILIGGFTVTDTGRYVGPEEILCVLFRRAGWKRVYGKFPDDEVHIVPGKLNN